MHHVSVRSIELVKESGVSEYYNSSIGAGWGALDFSWSAVLIDLVEKVI